ncbi:hypothetical protein VP1G_04247 [Cytospora mali]|uniref:Uncharacterized protein n=1 Tax=Cytospora mali TaxID=578113 RepID=A0A194UZB1_CYTMA|nr:hypothetical protein VP1G_04247 [Valsa mali var. pyri (nom. inval.)]
MSGSTSLSSSSSSSSSGYSATKQSRWSPASSEDGGTINGLQAQLRRGRDRMKQFWGRRFRGEDPYWTEYKRRRDDFAGFVVTRYHTPEPAAAAAAPPVAALDPRVRRCRRHDNLRQIYVEEEMMRQLEGALISRESSGNGNYIWETTKSTSTKEMNAIEGTDGIIEEALRS